MRPPGCRQHGRPTSTQLTLLVLPLLAMVVASSLISGAALGGGSGTGGTRAAGGLQPSVTGPPTIASFFASPNPVTEYSLTTLSVFASSPSGAPLSYSFQGLPGGCTSSNTSTLPCTPDAAGNFNVTVIVTDLSSGLSASSFDILTVTPVMTGTFFASSPYSIAPLPVYLNESGLSIGTAWSVSLGADRASARGPSIEMQEMGGTYAYSVASVAGYTVAPATGTVSVGAFPVAIAITFTPAPVYSLSFQESGLAANTTWAVTVAGTTTATNLTTISFLEPAGSYGYRVAAHSGYAAAPAVGTVSITGATSVAIAFSAAAGTAYNVSFSETGLLAGTVWSVTLNGTLYNTSGSTISVPELNAKLNFSVPGIAAFTETPDSGTVTVNGSAPAVQAITFRAMPLYTVVFRETGLPRGTAWSVTVNGTVYGGATPSVPVNLTNGSYSYTVGASALSSVPGYSVAPQAGTFSVLGGGSNVSLAYSRISRLGSVDSACQSLNSPPFYQNFCYPEAQSPTLLPLADGNVALATELYTNATSNLCAGAAGATLARIGFAVSTDGGSTFGASRTLGNDSCAYFDAVEPSFAVGGASVYGVFVEENSSALAANYVSRSGDALGFVRSLDNGTTFQAPVTLVSSGNIARPVVAAFGATVYLAYEDIANSSTPIGGGVLPISVQFLYSVNGGVSWQGPYTMPGLGATQGYDAFAPSIAVNATGTVAVTYATDRTCVPAGAGCLTYSDSIVTATSITNGSSWQGPRTVTTGAGETLCYTGACYPGYFESTPQIETAYDPSGENLYVADSATYNLGSSARSANYNVTGIFAFEMTPTTVTGGALSAPLTTTLVRSFNPGVGVGASGVFLTYLQMNETAGNQLPSNSISEWVVRSALGASPQWDAPVFADAVSFSPGGAVNSTRGSFPGFSSSVAFAASGNPLIAFAVPQAPLSSTSNGFGYYYVNNTYPTQLVVGAYVAPGSPNAAEVTFSASGFPAGRQWTLELDGLTISTTTPSITVTNLPAGLPVLESATYQPGYWEVVTNSFGPSLVTFYGNGTQSFFFDVWEGLELTALPSPYFSWLTTDYGYYQLSTLLFYSPFGAYASGSWSEYSSFFTYPYSVYTSLNYFGYSYSGTFFQSWGNTCVNSGCSYPTPWYFPYGSELELSGYSYSFLSPVPIYWTGTGAGSYSGSNLGGICFYEDCYPQSGLITMLGPVNETVWYGSAPFDPSSTVSVTTEGLPTGTGFSFSLDGVKYTGTAGVPVSIPNEASGSHTVRSVRAAALTPGWEYFGSVSGPNPFVTPVQTGVVLNFTALVNISAAPGTVSLFASGLTAGDSWSATLNGTTYTSSVPWINVSMRPGTYTYFVGDSENPNGSAGFLPNAPSGSLSVTPGVTYQFNYVAAYRVQLLASGGGLIGVAGGGTGTQLTLWRPAGSTVALSTIVSQGYSFIGWSGAGTNSYSGSSATPSIVVSGPLTESASFVPLPGARFNLTFLEAGLPSKAWWTISLNGSGYASPLPYLTVTHLYSYSSGAIYRLNVPTVYLNSTNLTRYVPTVYPNYVSSNGSATPPVLIVYAAQVHFELSSTAGGAVETTYQGRPLGSAGWIAQNSSATFTALADPGYTFSGWVGTGGASYTGPKAIVTVNATTPVEEVALFAAVVIPPPPLYTLTVTLSSMVASGTDWGISVGGTSYTSSSSVLQITGLAVGTYPVQVVTVTSPDGLVQYRATTNDPSAVSISGNLSISIALSAYYWVSISATSGGGVTPGPGYYAADSILYLVATPTSGMSFEGWSANQTIGYSGGNSTASLIVTGPVSEVATFTTSGPGPAVQSVWANPASWFGIGGLTLVVGLVLGFVFVRLGRQRPPTSRGTLAGSTGPRGGRP